MSNKLLFVFFIFIVVAFKPASGIYDITIHTLGGSPVSLSSFAGKKIIAFEFDANNYDQSQLLTLDTIQRSGLPVQVIGVPAKDFGSTATIQQIRALVQSLNLSFIITQPGYVKKSAGTNQQKIFKWVTHVNENSHFDNDADNPGQIYLISSEGVLYAMLGRGTPNAVVKELAGQ